MIKFFQELMHLCFHFDEELAKANEAPDSDELYAQKIRGTFEGLMGDKTIHYTL